MATRPIRTLRDFDDTGRSIRAFCSHYWVCSHEAQLRLEMLAFRLGWEFDFYEDRDYLAARLRCSLCGWYYPDFALGQARKPPEFSSMHGAGGVPLSQDELISMTRFRAANVASEMPWVGNRRRRRR